MVNTIGNKISSKAIHKNCQDVVNAIVKTHHKILQNFTKNEVLPFRNNKVIASLSNYCLSDNEVSLVKNGLYFTISLANLIKTNISVSFKNMCNFLTLSLENKEEKVR